MGRPRIKFEFKKKNGRRTKAFSCTNLEWEIFERFAKYARAQGRSESRQLVIVINKFLAEQEFIDDLNDLTKSKKTLHVCDFHKGSKKQSSENEIVKEGNSPIYTSEKMNSLGGGLPAKPEHTCYGMSADLSKEE